MVGNGAPVVAAVRQLPGVCSAEAEYAPGGAVTALRVRLAPGVDRGAVEAAVRRVSSAHFGHAVDQERVSVVPADVAAPEPSARIPRARSARLQLLRTDVVTAGTELTATVTLTAGPRTSTGDCTGALTAGSGPRAVATATLRALEALLTGAGHLELDHVETQRAHGTVVLVAVTLVTAAGAQQLTGSALVRHEESDAVVRATLDAANRRVEALLR